MKMKKLAMLLNLFALSSFAITASVYAQTYLGFKAPEKENVWGHDGVPDAGAIANYFEPIPGFHIIGPGGAGITADGRFSGFSKDTRVVHVVKDALGVISVIDLVTHWDGEAAMHKVNQAYFNIPKHGRARLVADSDVFAVEGTTVFYKKEAVDHEVFMRWNSSRGEYDLFSKGSPKGFRGQIATHRDGDAGVVAQIKSVFFPEEGAFFRSANLEVTGAVLLPRIKTPVTSQIPKTSFLLHSGFSFVQPLKTANPGDTHAFSLAK